MPKTSKPTEQKHVIQVEVKQAPYCESCDALRLEDEDHLAAMYECGDCGNEFTRDDSADGDSNRCPDCNKFGAKMESKVQCTGCGSELDLDDEDEMRYYFAADPAGDEEHVIVPPDIIIDASTTPAA